MQLTQSSVCDFGQDVATGHLDSMNVKPRCVVVDDDVEFLDRLTRWFLTNCFNFDVLGFSSSVAAVEYVRLHRVDLILTAYLVPQIDGLQFISLVRSFNAQVPIVMLSGVPIKTVAIARGASAFLAKGAHWSHLSQTVNRLCAAPLLETN